MSEHPPDSVALQAASDLIAFPSVSVNSNAEVTDWLEGRLQALGCRTERLEYTDPNGVRKATVTGRMGPEPTAARPGLAYFAHSDVVPTDRWQLPESFQGLDFPRELRKRGPFEPTLAVDRLFGRGACDMKGSIACALAAAGRYAGKTLQAPFFLMVAADEEIGGQGAQYFVDKSAMYPEMVAAQTPGIVGEPTRLEVIYTHKGVCGFTATARGRAAHSSTGKGTNANLAMIPFLADMKRIHYEAMTNSAWQNPDFDPPFLCWNIGINDHNSALNITAPLSVCTVYFRPMPGVPAAPLLDRVRASAAECGLELKVTHDMPPLRTDPQAPFVKECLRLAGCTKPGTAPYGTDGLRLGALKQLVVMGPGDIAQAHTRDEWIELSQLSAGTNLYASLIQRYCIDV